MKFQILVETEIDIKTLKVSAGVRYWDDSGVNGIADSENGAGIPCRDGDSWCPEIDVETGKILNWRKGTTADIHYKVCDCCGWELIDKDGNVVLSAEDGYVPDTLSPKEEGYGDYIIMDINEDGIIQDWKFDFSDFEQDEKDEL